MDRDNHYETAFESYLHEQRLSYVAVDESRRSYFGEAPVKSLDFLVFGAGGAKLCVDIKGRRFPGGSAGRPRWVWECWSSRQDIEALVCWARLAGEGYRGLLVFAYWLGARVEVPAATPDLHHWRGRRYLFRAVDAEIYGEYMRRRSPRWQTVTLARADFRVLVRPFRDFVRQEQPAECPF